MYDIKSKILLNKVIGIMSEEQLLDKLKIKFKGEKMIFSIKKEDFKNVM
jgi:hypothetical protein